MAKDWDPFKPGWGENKDDGFDAFKPVESHANPAYGSVSSAGWGSGTGENKNSAFAPVDWGSGNKSGASWAYQTASSQSTNFYGSNPSQSKNWAFGGPQRHNSIFSASGASRDHDMFHLENEHRQAGWSWGDNFHWGDAHRHLERTHRIADHRWHSHGSAWSFGQSGSSSSSWAFDSSSSKSSGWGASSSTKSTNWAFEAKPLKKTW